MMSNDTAVSYDQFRRYAQRFIAVMDRAQTLPTRSFLLELGSALAELYALALMLPDPGAGGRARSPVDVAIPSLEALHTVVSGDGPGSPAHTLTDDLAAVYRALKSGMVRMSHGTAPSEILRHWRHTFQTDWGDHATAAMRAIYLVLRDSTLTPSGR